MRLERKGRAVLIVRDDGSEQAIEGAALTLHTDFGLSNWYGTEIREEWGEAHLYRRDATLHLVVSQVVAGCADIGRSAVGYWFSDDDGRTWARDPAPKIRADEPAIGAVTTHPRERPYPGAG